MKKTKLQMLIDGKLYLWLVLVAFPSLILAGCGEDNNPDSLRCRVRAVAGQEDDVVGTWKLVKMRRGFSLETNDHSCDNVVYHFRTDGTLEVSSNIEQVPYSSGETGLTYELIPAEQTAEPFPLPLRMRISVSPAASFNWFFTIDATTMTLDGSPVDGAKMEFIRID